MLAKITRHAGAKCKLRNQKPKRRADNAEQQTFSKELPN